MKIGIIGTGNMGRSLGILLAQLGHSVLFGARDRAKAEAAAQLAGHNARSGTNDEAAHFGEVLLWSVRGAPASAIVSDLGAVRGKTVIDLNNNETRTDGGIGPAGEPAGVRLQRELEGAFVVKAFNTFPMELFEVDPALLREKRVAAFIASDHAESKTLVADLAASLGFHPIDFGPLRFCGMLEGISDIVRNLAGLGVPFPFSLSVVELPAPATRRLGGRQPSRLK